MAIMDFLRPQWKHSNPELRAAALRALQDDRQEVFLSVTLEDPDPALRLAASKRLNQETALRQALDKSSDKSVQDISRKTLNQILTEQVKAASSQELDAARGWMKELQSIDKAVEDIARNARSPEIRREASAALTHASAILNVTLEEDVTDIALSALARLSREPHLQSVAKSAKAREARAKAKERLKVIEDSKKPDALAVYRAKLQLILAVAEKAEAGTAELNPNFPWEATLEQVDEAERALRELMESGATLDNGQVVLFRNRVTAFRNRLTRHRASEVSRAERERDEKHNREIKESLCARMEEIFASSQAVDSAEIDTLTRRFESTGPCPEDDALRDKFRLAKSRVVRERLQKQREIEETARRKNEAENEEARKEDARRRAEAWAKHGPKLVEWIVELEELSGSSDVKHSEKRLRDIQSQWKNLIVNAPEDEAARLNSRYHAVADRLREAMDWLRWSNLHCKQDICAQLEALIPQEDLKSLVTRFKGLLSEWKTVGPVPWENTEATWDRYHQACDALYEKCREYFAEIEEELESNARAKEEICVKLEALLAQEGGDWRESNETFREAQSAWKAIGSAPRDKNDALWARYRNICQSFYGRKDQQQQDNLKQKLELVALAEGLKDSTDWKNTAAQIKEAQEKWKSIGPVPKDEAEGLWQRFHAACETFFQARKAHFEKMEQDRPANLEKKLALCELVEKLNELPSDKERYERILDAQAQWKEIGPVPREQEDAVWERFRKPMDDYFQERRERMKNERAQREENAKIKEDLCIEAEALRDSTDWKATIEKIKALQARWKTSGPTFRDLDQELWKRFRGACDAFFDRLKENSAKRDQEREGNLLKKIDICFTIEILSGTPPADDESKHAREAWIETQRAKGASVPQPMDDWKKATDRVKYFQGEWKKVGPAPREQNELIWDRFQRANDLFFEERRRAMGLPADDPQANLEGKLALIADAEELAHDPGSHNTDTVRKLFQQWKRIGPVPRAQSDYVWERFSTACDTAVGKTTEPAGA
ncbi:MAG TPA: hypothetical protein DCQ83_07855 [Fibrobacteres bacterium]|nr:hypothetical protein [Fibrobacterota bacterium]